MSDSGRQIGDKSMLTHGQLLAKVQLLQDERNALQAFKNFVHGRLDSAGTPKEFPDGVHTREGCRIGDRLDWVFAKTETHAEVIGENMELEAKLDDREAELEKLRAERDQLKADLATCAERLAKTSDQLGRVAQREAVWITDPALIKDEAWYLVIGVKNGLADDAAVMYQGADLKPWLNLKLVAAIKIDRRIDGGQRAAISSASTDAATAIPYDGGP